MNPVKPSVHQAQDAVYIYEAPLRLWHWINALAIVVLAVTGYFIGSPPPSLTGEASDHYLFGDIRFAHFVAAYVLIVGCAFRLYWAFAGNHHARQIFLPRVWSPRWWSEVFYELAWYAMLVKEPKKYEGHTPWRRWSCTCCSSGAGPS
jgi:Ni/Fe-hydrogenase 1 B-type cytochrome subunit